MSRQQGRCRDLSVWGEDDSRLVEGDGKGAGQTRGSWTEVRDSERRVGSRGSVGRFGVRRHVC